MPEDLELTLEAFERAGDAAGAVALWEANLAALDQLDDSPSPGQEGREGREGGACRRRTTLAAWAWAGWVANRRGGRGRP